MTAPADQQRLLEALLFAAPAPLFEAELAERLGVEADIAGLLHELAASYAERGINLVRLAGGWTFRTAPDLAPFLVSERPVSRKLSRAAVETLAIIAYHQPVTRAEIEAIRGVALARGTLDRLDDLPGLDELRAAGLLDIGPAVLGEAAEPAIEEAEADEFEA